MQPRNSVIFEYNLKMYCYTWTQHIDVMELEIVDLKRFEIFVDKYFNIWGKFGVNLNLDHVS